MFNCVGIFHCHSFVFSGVCVSILNLGRTAPFFIGGGSSDWSLRFFLLICWEVFCSCFVFFSGRKSSKKQKSEIHFLTGFLGEYPF